MVKTSNIGHGKLLVLVGAVLAVLTLSACKSAMTYPDRSQWEELDELSAGG